MNDTALHAPGRILVVAPFLHRLGHFSVYPLELAAGFAANGHEVEILYPRACPAGTRAAQEFSVSCIATSPHAHQLLGRLMYSRPILLCLIWLIARTKAGDYDLVYWSDFKADNQASTWPLAFARFFQLYRHPTAFTEHHNFNWRRHRVARLLRLDRLRLRRLTMFVHSGKLLEWIRLNMAWPQIGHYVEHGQRPDPVSEDERRAARAQMDIHDDERVLLVFGLQAIRRKEIDTLALALRELTLSRPLLVLCVGASTGDTLHPLDDPIFSQLPNLRIERIESFVAEEAVKSFFAAADLVWSYYGGFMGASGVLAQAVSYGRMAICASEGESGDMCRRHALGFDTPNGDLASLRATLMRFVELPVSEQMRYEKAVREAAMATTWQAIARRIYVMAGAGAVR